MQRLITWLTDGVWPVLLTMDKDSRRHLISGAYVIKARAYDNIDKPNLRVLDFRRPPMSP